MRSPSVAIGAAAAVVAFLPRPWAPAAAVGLAVAAALVADPQALADAWRLRTLALLTAVGVLTGLTVASVTGPSHGIAVGTAVLLRFLALLLLASLIARNVDADRLVAFARQAGLDRVALVLGLALNTLPHLADAVRQSWIALAARSGGRVPLRRAPLAAETLVAHTARLAEDAAAAAALRGHRALAARPDRNRRLPTMVVVTGDAGSGKTPAVEQAARRLSDGGVAIAGFVQHATRDGGEKTGFEVLDLVTGASRPLAHHVGRDRGEHGTRFVFDRAGFALARRALRRDRRTQVLVVDELGPLELRGDGHMPALRSALPRLGAGVLLCSVRRHLLAAAVEAVPAASVVVVDLSQTRDGVAVVTAAVAAALAAREERT